MFELILALLLLCVVFILGNSLKSAPVRGFDRAADKVVSRIPKFTGALLTILSYLTRPLFLGIIATFVFICIWILQSHTKNMYLLAMIIGMGTIEMAKLYFRRPRRDDPNVDAHHITSFSYPSGHAGSSLLFALVMSTLHPIPAVLTAIFILLALSVGVSRIYIRVHYPSDVVGAWTMAVGIYSLILFLGLK